jgi:hypothetical protein
MVYRECTCCEERPDEPTKYQVNQMIQPDTLIKDERYDFFSRIGVCLVQQRASGCIFRIVLVVRSFLGTPVRLAILAFLVAD